ncbi:substrate-binding domain-containing protein [Ammoniphilus resinae]|uniref:Molybdopterin biosynthesis protein n=1 Tax=Ammoniphilus resinae TaxID=861532 RepID=A0ABS4GIK5_9BACL|nr:helix-turn-helix transcriptional regulator [Ammoniphilus resinae]MBP1930088.1 putative molybdopterin biosynthesis protein [Ammoniphilus resinae]
MVEQAYTPDEVAKILKISKNTVYELIKRGELQAYRVSNKMRIDPQALERYKENMQTIGGDHQTSLGKSTQILRLAGSHDFLLEHLVSFAGKAGAPFFIQPTYIGSLEGLMMLYRGATDIAAIHLLDPASGQYNLPFIERIFYHEPITVLHLATRTQGLIVPPGNPKGIHSWEDLTRKEVRFVNRQKGAGTRFLLDYHMGKLHLSPQDIQGYEVEEWNHFATAAHVARGTADVALGIEAAADKLGLSFTPLTIESFDLVLRSTPENQELLNAFQEFIGSQDFTESLKDLKGYDCSHLGETLFKGGVQV